MNWQKDFENVYLMLNICFTTPLVLLLNEIEYTISIST